MGKQSQANKNFWYAYALWQQKVAQALARRRAEALVRKRAEVEARARQAQLSSQSRQVNPYPLALFLAIVIVGAGALLGTVQTKSSKDTSDFHKETVEESQTTTQFCNQVTRSNPFLWDDLVCAGVGVIENFDDVGRLADDIAEGLQHIITGTTTSSGLAQMLEENMLLQKGGNTSSLIVSLSTTTTAVETQEDEDESQYIILYHYTRAENVANILATGLNPSIQGSGRRGDARYGSGQYFTDLTPEESRLLSREDHSNALFNVPTRWGTPPMISNIAWIKFKLRLDSVTPVHSLYVEAVSYRSIFLYRSESILAPFDIIDFNVGIIGYGPVIFSDFTD